MNNYEMNKMILQLNLLGFRRSAQWWLGGGLLLMFWSPILMMDIQTFTLFIPMLVSGILVLIKGSFLWMDYAQLNERFRYFMERDVMREFREAASARPGHFPGPVPIKRPIPQL